MTSWNGALVVEGMAIGGSFLIWVVGGGGCIDESKKESLDICVFWFLSDLIL